jgi:hypothetical protein
LAEWQNLIRKLENEANEIGFDRDYKLKPLLPSIYFIRIFMYLIPQRFANERVRWAVP